MRKLLKVFLRVNKRRSRTYFDRWKMQTELRKTVLNNYNTIFQINDKSDQSNLIGDNINNRLYENVKKLILRLSNNYCEEMTRTVIQNITRDPHFVKKGLNIKLNKLINEILNEII